MSENYNGYVIPDQGDINWAPTEVAFHKQLINDVVDRKRAVQTATTFSAIATVNPSPLVGDRIYVQDSTATYVYGTSWTVESIANKTAFAAANPSSVVTSVLPTDQIVIDRGGTTYITNASLFSSFDFIDPYDYFFGTVPTGWLNTMISNGITNIKLGNHVYPFANTPGDPIVRDTPNVQIIGTYLPVLASDTNSITSGSIILGGIQFIRCNSLLVRGVGIDAGANYRGTSGQFNPTGGIIVDSSNNICIESNLVLMVNADPFTHCILHEKCYYCKVTRNVTWYGIHGIAIKSQFVYLDDNYVNSVPNGLTLKSDTIATGTGYVCSDVYVGTHNTLDCGNGISVGPGGTEASGAAVYRVYVNCLKARMSVMNTGIGSTAISYAWQNSTDEVVQFVVNQVQAYNITFAVYPVNQCTLKNCIINSIVAENGSRAIIADLGIGSNSFVIGSISADNITYGIAAVNYAKIIVGSLRMNGGSAGVAAVPVNGMVRLGTYIGSTGVRPFIQNFTYQNSCADYSGNPVAITKIGGATRLEGRITPGTSSLTSNYNIIQLPIWLYSPVAKTFTINVLVGSSIQSATLNVSTGGMLTLVSLPASTTYIILDGVSWGDYI